MHFAQMAQTARVADARQAAGSQVGGVEQDQVHERSEDAGGHDSRDRGG